MHTLPDFPVNGCKSLFVQLSLHINDFFLALTSVKQRLVYLKVQEYCRKRKCAEKTQTNWSGTQLVLTVFGSDILAAGLMQSSCGIVCISRKVPLPRVKMGMVPFFWKIDDTLDEKF